MAVGEKGEKMNYYIDGNIARKLNNKTVDNSNIQYQGKYKQNTVSQVSEAPKGISAICFIVLLISIVATLATAVIYLKNMDSLRSIEKQITNLEKDYNELREDNNIKRTRLDAMVDLDEIYRIATEELKMIKPDEDHVIKFASTKTSYLKQYKNIP